LRDETIGQVPGVFRRWLGTAQDDRTCAWGKLGQGARDDLVENGRGRDLLVVIENEDGGIA